MKTAHKIIALAIAGLGFVSCCGIKRDTKEVITYKEEVRTVTPGGKGSLPYTEIVKVPVVSTEKVKCDCTDSYSPKSDCCGRLSKEVLRRATVQGGTGEPHIGLIPTMRPLIPEIVKNEN